MILNNIIDYGNNIKYNFKLQVNLESFDYIKKWIRVLETRSLFKLGECNLSREQMLKIY